MQTPFQRRYTRVRFVSAASLELGGQQLDATVLDLSLKGVLLAVDRPPAAATGDAVTLILQLDDDPDAAIVMGGRLARVDGNHLGLTWELIDLDSMTRLRRLLELNLGDAQLVHRELASLWETRPGA